MVEKKTGGATSSPRSGLAIAFAEDSADFMDFPQAFGALAAKGAILRHGSCKQDSVVRSQIFTVLSAEALASNFLIEGIRKFPLGRFETYV